MWVIQSRVKSPIWHPGIRKPWRYISSTLGGIIQMAESIVLESDNLSSYWAKKGELIGWWKKGQGILWVREIGGSSSFFFFFDMKLLVSIEEMGAKILIT